jgi:hypothetical protein
MISLSLLIRLRGLPSLTLSSLIPLLAGVTVAQAQVPAGASRPRAVPEEYVATPMGYFHPSCVQALAEGDIIRKDELAIEHKDGSFDAIPACAYPHYTPAGEEVPLDGAGPAAEKTAASDGAGGEPPAIGHDYIEYADMREAEPSNYYGELKATWIVPPDPATHSNQIIYLFPGMQDYHTGLKDLTILQPVLGWNVVYPAQGINLPNVWSLSSWNCCVKGAVQHSPAITTAAGHTIFGVMVCTHPDAPRCGSFNVNTYDETAGTMTELRQTSSFGQYFNWAIAGALEVYNISQCSEYPGGTKGSIEFYDLGLYDNGLHPVTQGWVKEKVWIAQHDTPVCGYDVSGGFKDGIPQITLSY